jgi:hypothetical protein
MRREGQVLFPEEVGGHDGLTMSEKLHGRERRTNTKRWQCSAKWFRLCQHLRDSLVEPERFLFKVTNLLKGIKDLN